MLPSFSPGAGPLALNTHRLHEKHRLVVLCVSVCLVYAGQVRTWPGHSRGSPTAPPARATGRVPGLGANGRELAPTADCDQDLIT